MAGSWIRDSPIADARTLRINAIGSKRGGEGADGRQGEAVRTSVPDVGADRRRAYREYRAEQAHLHLSPRIGAPHRPRMFSTNKSRPLRSTSRKPTGPSNAVPSGRVPAESIGSVPESPPSSRHLPSPSKFSSAKPIGSMILWQTAHEGEVACSVMRWRMDSFVWVASSFKNGTLAGGGGGGVPSSCSSTHFPRMVGAVRFG